MSLDQLNEEMVSLKELRMVNIRQLSGPAMRAYSAELKSMMEVIEVTYSSPLDQAEQELRFCEDDVMSQPRGFVTYQLEYEKSLMGSQGQKGDTVVIDKDHGKPTKVNSSDLPKLQPNPTIDQYLNWLSDLRIAFRESGCPQKEWMFHVPSLVSKNHNVHAKAKHINGQERLSENSFGEFIAIIEPMLYPAGIEGEIRRRLRDVDFTSRKDFSVREVLALRHDLIMRRFPEAADEAPETETLRWEEMWSGLAPPLLLKLRQACKDIWDGRFVDIINHEAVLLAELSTLLGTTSDSKPKGGKTEGKGAKNDSPNQKRSHPTGNKPGGNKSQRKGKTSGRERSAVNPDGSPVCFACTNQGLTCKAKVY